MKKLCVSFLLFVVFIGRANCASVSVSASSNTVTVGSGVTFYVNISSAAAWDLKGESFGSTDGCSLGDQGVGDSGSGNNVNKTLSVYCNASSTGQIGFSVTGNITDASSGNAVDVSGSKTVVVVNPRQKDSNNDLSSLGVEGYSISPSFSADVLEYSVDVPSTVNDVNITGSPSSSYASIEGVGKKEVNEGANLFEIKVISETGVPKVYKLTVNVKDDNPINVSIDNVSYTLIKNVKNIVKPDLYEEKSVTISNVSIPAFYNETTNVTLVGIKDKSGLVRLAVYDSSNNSYTLYEEAKSDQMILMIKSIPSLKDGLIESKVMIDDVEYDCLKFSMDSLYSVIYATNLVSGESDYYLYDSKENSYVRYTDEALIPLKDEINKYKEVVKYLVIGLVCVSLLVVILIITRPRRKKNIKKKEKVSEVKEKNIVKDVSKEEVKVDTSKRKKGSTKKATAELDKATEIIDNYENNLKDKKKDEDDDMYDIFEDDRKKRKKK